MGNFIPYNYLFQVIINFFNFEKDFIACIALDRMKLTV